MLPFIACDLDQAVVGAGPDQDVRQGRGSNGKNGVVIFGAGIVDGDWAARSLLFRFVVARQVATDRFPVGAAVGGLEDALASVVNRVRIVRRGHDGRRPLKTVIEWGRTPRVGEFGPHGNALDLVRAAVKARDVALIVAGIHDVRVGGIGGNVSGFPAPNGIPFVASNRAFIAAAGRDEWYAVG